MGCVPVHLCLLLYTKSHFNYPCLLDGLKTVYREDGFKGLYRGTSLALVGVTNGALQFMCYEQMKWLCFEQKRRRYRNAGKEWTTEADKLVSSRISLFFCESIDFLILYGGV